MYSVLITRKDTGNVIAQVSVNLRGMNYAPSDAEYESEAWTTAQEDRLVGPEADRGDFAFEIVPVSIRDAFSGKR